MRASTDGEHEELTVQFNPFSISTCLLIINRLISLILRRYKTSINHYLYKHRNTWVKFCKRTGQYPAKMRCMHKASLELNYTRLLHPVQSRSAQRYHDSNPDGLSVREKELAKCSFLPHKKKHNSSRTWMKNLQQVDFGDEKMMRRKGRKDAARTTSPASSPRLDSRRLDSFNPRSSTFFSLLIFQTSASLPAKSSPRYSCTIAQPIYD